MRERDPIGDGVTPLEIMVEMMRDTTKSDEMRLRAAADAAPYVHRKQPQDMHHTGEAVPVSITMNVVGPRRA